MPALGARRSTLKYFPEVSEWKKPDEVLLQVWAAFGQCLLRTYLKRFPCEGRLVGRDFAPLLT